MNFELEALLRDLFSVNVPLAQWAEEAASIGFTVEEIKAKLRRAIAIIDGERA